MAKIALDGLPCNTIGDLPSVGTQAPDFRVTGKDLVDVGLADYKGKKKLISIISSVDTMVCGNSVKKFDDAAEGNKNAVFLIVSMDLPFAMARFCGKAKLKNVIPLSMMRSRHFAKDYGVLITDGPFAGVAARAVLVLDENDKIIYSELVPDIGQEPNYDKALTALG